MLLVQMQEQVLSRVLLAVTMVIDLCACAFNFICSGVNNFQGSAIALTTVQYRLILHSNGPIRLQYLLQLYNNQNLFDSFHGTLDPHCFEANKED